jgi:hypothetical protein
MAIAGRVAIVPKDDYDASLIYKRLDAVMHNNTLYIAKKNVPAGKVPGADTKDYWMSGPSAGASKPATTTSNGLMSATDKKAIEVLKKPLATCATGRATAAKVATLANFVLQVGTSIAVKFTDTVGTANPTTGNLTLNVNGTGAKTIGYFRNGNKAAISYASGNFFYNNATHIFTYDGTFWLCMDWNADNNTTYSNFVKSGTGAKAGLVPAPSTTAGTSKYLREDGTWQTPPDTKTSVVNNQTTTVAGYALDARQANPNIDGTLAKQLSDLNGSLNDFLRGVNGTYDIPGAFMMGFGGMSVAAPISDALRNKTITINKCRVQESASEIELPGSSTVFKYPSILLLVHNGITERYTGHFAVFTVTVS